MKKIIILLFAMIMSINIIAQSAETTRLFGHDVPNDAINHTCFMAITSAAITAQTYGWTENRWLSTGLGFLGAIGVGVLYENYNANNGGVFSKRDMKNNTIGAMVGSLSVNLVILGPHEIINNIRKRRDKRRNRRSLKY